MWIVTYTTYLGGMESLACKRFKAKTTAILFSSKVNGTIERRIFK